MAQSSCQSGEAPENDSRRFYSFEQIASVSPHADTDEAANRALTSEQVREGFQGLNRIHRQFGKISNQLILDVNDDIISSIYAVLKEEVCEGFRRLNTIHRQFGMISDHLLSEENDDIMSSLYAVIKEEMQKEGAGLATNQNPVHRVAISTLTPMVMQVPAPASTPVLKLCFGCKFPKTIYANIRIADPNNNPIQVKLIDSNTDDIYEKPLPPMEVNFEVINAELFHPMDAFTWDSDSNDLSNCILKPRKGRVRWLVGTSTSILMNKGICQIEDLSFTDNTNRTTTRLVAVARLKSGDCGGMTIRCAVSEEFTVKDRRGKAYEKHLIPALDDEVWRLEKIRKNGIYHKRLSIEGINNVRDVIIKWMANEEKLKNILDMKDDHWRKFINHANKCDRGNSRFKFGNGDIVIVFNATGVIMQLIIEGVIHEYGNLDKQNRVTLDRVYELASEAYERWGEVQEVKPGELEKLLQPLPFKNVVGTSIDDNSQLLETPAAAGNSDHLVSLDGCSNWTYDSEPMCSETNVSTNLVQNRANLEEPYQVMSDQ